MGLHEQKGAPLNETLQQELELFNNCDSLTGNKVDELRYLFLSSQVELVSDISAIQTAEYKGESGFVALSFLYQLMYYNKDNARFLMVPIRFSQHEHRILTGQKPYFKRVLPLFSKP